MGSEKILSRYFYLRYHIKGRYLLTWPDICWRDKISADIGSGRGGSMHGHDNNVDTSLNQDCRRRIPPFASSPSSPWRTSGLWRRRLPTSRGSSSRRRWCTTTTTAGALTMGGGRQTGGRLQQWHWWPICSDDMLGWWRWGAWGAFRSSSSWWNDDPNSITRKAREDDKIISAILVVKQLVSGGPAWRWCTCR